MSRPLVHGSMRLSNWGSGPRGHLRGTCDMLEGNFICKSATLYNLPILMSSFKMYVKKNKYRKIITKQCIVLYKYMLIWALDLKISDPYLERSKPDATPFLAMTLLHSCNAFGTTENSYFAKYSFDATKVRKLVKAIEPFAIYLVTSCVPGADALFNRNY